MLFTPKLKTQKIESELASNTRKAAATKIDITITSLTIDRKKGIAIKTTFHW